MFFVGKNFVIDTDGDNIMVFCTTTNTSMSFDNLDDAFENMKDFLGFIDMETSKIRSKGYSEGFFEGKMSTNELIKRKIGGRDAKKRIEQT